MIIRALQESDIPELKRINSEYYPDDSFPDFKENFLSVVVITDDDGTIITCGGVELIAESVSITNQAIPSNVRTKALLMLLDNMKYTCSGHRYNYMHAFVTDDEHWEKMLRKVGFKQLDSDVLYLEVNDNG
jgi:N-acetylglutamate synthase-like GNAT family acetyltransferase